MTAGAGYRAPVPQENYPPAAGDMPGTARTHVELLVLGGGSAAEELCSALAEESGGGRVPFSVAVVERRLVGGECPFLACMPSKAFLRSAALRRLGGSMEGLGAGPATAAASAGGPGRARPELAAAVRRRDLVAECRDDSEHVSDLEGLGVEVVRGQARLTHARGAHVGLEGGGERRLDAERIVIATGSRPVMPPIDGIDGVAVWTSDDALSANDQPRSVVVLGGGPVGCELAEMYAPWLESVVLVEHDDRLLANEDEEVSRYVAAHLRRIGVDVRTGTRAEAVATASAPTATERDRHHPAGGRRSRPVEVRLSDGEVVTCERLVVATGRNPDYEGLGLEVLGLSPGDSGALEVDEHCEVRGAPGVFALGDANGLAPFTHAAKYEARVLAAHLLGLDRRLDLRAVPRCVYTDPPVAGVGLTPQAAEEEGIDVLCARLDFSGAARAQSDWRLLPPAPEAPEDVEGGGLGEPAGGCAVLVADRARGVLVGASAVGPHADEWISELSLAVRAETPLEVLLDVVHPFPTYCEVLEPALSDLARQLRRPGPTGARPADADAQRDGAGRR